MGWHDDGMEMSQDGGMDGWGMFRCNNSEMEFLPVCDRSSPIVRVCCYMPA